MSETTIVAAAAGWTLGVSGTIVRGTLASKHIKWSWPIVGWEITKVKDKYWYGLWDNDVRPITVTPSSLCGEYSCWVVRSPDQKYVVYVPGIIARNRYDVLRALPNHHDVLRLHDKLQFESEDEALKHCIKLEEAVAAYIDYTDEENDAVVHEQNAA